MVLKRLANGLVDGAASGLASAKDAKVKAKAKAKARKAKPAKPKGKAEAHADRSRTAKVLGDEEDMLKIEDESSNEDPDGPTRPGQEAAPYFSSFQRRNFEPFTILPGRCTVLQKDVHTIATEFKKRLQAKAADGDFGQRELPYVGGFAIFREIFTEWGFSVIVEYNKLEVDRDCFQYICGICWCAMSDADNIVSKVAIVFLLYLLFANQKEQVFAIPASQEVLEELVVLQTILSGHCRATTVSSVSEVAGFVDNASAVYLQAACVSRTSLARAPTLRVVWLD
ncbi:unnamed protein product [Symbiodinium natans]|uniref:Uncharacterized protein n=1 Tax=Symbiodinium natans TaxID=878477 RepID=A0A812L7Z2_9DINO|nr:unnamed protein product [Symbiodinium natans]